jgi:diguanylate cyclase (GGDEF)-like protein
MTDLAQSDALTGLPNRRVWDARVKEAVSDHREFVVAMFDIDHFKAFNDSHGHPAGDRLLKETSAAWRDQLRDGDLLARLGGEEFGLLLIDTDRRTATGVIERLRGCVSQGRTCSAGLAVRKLGESAESVISRADRALYEAKARGRNRACISA